MAETRLVGPIPDGRDADEYDRLRRRVLWSMPSGLYVLGSTDGTRRNLMTLNWATQVATDPKLLAVSVEKPALSHRLVRDGQGFVVNIVAREDRAIVRKFVKPLDDGGDPNHLAGFEVRPAGTTGAPILAGAAAWIECRLWQEVDSGSHSLFLGEVVDCGSGPSGLDAAPALRMEDTRMNYGG